MTLRLRLLLPFLAVVGASTATTLRAQDAPPPPANRQQWTAAIRQAFSAHKPQLETIRGVSGQLRPELTIVVQPDGAIADVTVKRTSGFQAADDAAVAMIRNAGGLPPFTADMPKDRLTFSLPVALNFAPKEEADQRLYIDTVSGMRLEVRPPLVIRAAQPDPRFDLVVRVETGQEATPYAAAGEPLCIVGFRKPAASQTEPDAQRRAEQARDELVRQSSEKGLEAEKVEIVDYRAAKLIELSLKPKPGSEPSGRRYYTSSFELPGGGYTLFCASDETRAPAAIEAFRAIRDGATSLQR